MADCSGSGWDRRPSTGDARGDTHLQMHPIFGDMYWTGDRRRAQTTQQTTTGVWSGLGGAAGVKTVMLEEGKGVREESEGGDIGGNSVNSGGRRDMLPWREEGSCSKAQLDVREIDGNETRLDVWTYIRRCGMF